MEGDAPSEVIDLDEEIASIRFNNGCGRMRCVNQTSPNCACFREIDALTDHPTTETLTP